MRYFIKGAVSAIALLFPVVSHSQNNFTTTGAVQISVGQGNVAPDSFSAEPASPPNKNLLVFSSFASNLVAGDTNTTSDVFQFTPENGIELISVVPTTGRAPQTAGSSNPAVSAVQPDGSYGVAFISSATDLVPNYASSVSSEYNPRQVYIRLPLSNETLLVSKGFPTTGAPNSSPNQQVGADADCDQVAIVALQNPPRYLVAFRSFAGNLVQPPAATGQEFRTIFTVPITFANGRAVVGSPDEALDPSTGRRYFGDLNNPQFSGNGRFMAVNTTAPITGVQSEFQQVYLHDRNTKANKLISRTADGLPGNGDSIKPAVSHRAENIIFTSNASNVVGGGTTSKLIRFDNEVEQLSQINTSATGEASNGDAYQAQISPSGLLVTFSDSGTNLVADTNTNGRVQTYLKDLRSGSVVRTSVTSTLAAGNGDSGANISQVYPTQSTPISSPTVYDSSSTLAFGAPGYNGSTLFTSFRSDAENLSTYPTFLPAVDIASLPVLGNVFRTAITPPKPTLVQNGSIEAPPDVVILKRLAGKKGARVQIILQEFTDLIPLSQVSAASVEGLASASARLKYNLEIRKAGSKQQIFRTLNKNKTVINRLAPGRYAIRYRVSKKVGKKTIKSGYSARQQLTVS
jgi:hypothetical protein